MDASLRAHLDQHLGVCSALAAAGLGLTPNDLRRLVRDGELVRVARGAYLDAQRLRGATPEEAHVARTIAVVLSRRGALAASHASAALVHGLPVLRAELGTIRVVHTRDRVNTRQHDAFTVHPCPGPEGLTKVRGVPSVIPALAVIGTAMANGARSGLMAADAALRRKMTTRAELQHWLGVLTRHPGIDRARSVVTEADPSAESPGESLLRKVLIRLGYEVIPQHKIKNGDIVVARVDFYLPALDVVVEFDGEVKYGGQNGQAELAKEKARERRIERLGYGVARIIWADLFDPRRVQAEVQAARRRR